MKYLVYLLILGACATQQDRVEARKNIASSLIGCPPQDIEIKDGVQKAYYSTFTATCNEEIYYCSTQLKGMSGIIADSDTKCKKGKKSK